MNRLNKSRLFRIGLPASLGLTHLYSAHAQAPYPFVPADFDIPEALETESYRLRMLTVNDVVKDYDAVISSVEHIRSVWRPESSWPTSDLSLEQDLIDLGWHQGEFERRRSFAYTVVTLDESRVIGCVYIRPTRKAGYDALIELWTRPPEQTDLVDEDRLRAVVKAWLRQEWLFENPAFPGADISWEEWRNIEEVKR